MCNRNAQEVQSRYVRQNKDILVMKLEEAIELWRERDKIKPLKWRDKQGLRFIEKQVSALKSAQAKGWDKKTYKKEIKESGAEKELVAHTGFNPLDKK